jgi:hypothetical protein
MNAWDPSKPLPWIVVLLSSHKLLNLNAEAEQRASCKKKKKKKKWRHPRWASVRTAASARQDSTWKIEIRIEHNYGRWWATANRLSSRF